MADTKFKKGNIAWNKGKKSSLEWKTKLSLSAKQRGQVPPSRKGTKASQETIEKMRGHKAWNNGIKMPCQVWNKGKKGLQSMSLEARKKMSESHRGEKAYQWKGNSTLTFQIRNCFKYRQWRSDVFTRDSFTCQGNGCGDCRVGNLQADHKKPFALILEHNNIKNIEEALECEELWNINNGITLCIPCHKKTDTWGYKTKVLLNKKIK